MIKAAIVGMGWWGRTLVEAVQSDSDQIRFVAGATRTVSPEVKTFGETHQVKLVDSGCCGMAGSFGYEHYDVSMAIGGRVLFPAVRGAPAATIAAPGFSCRHQIEHGTGRRAKHPIELLAEYLV